MRALLLVLVAGCMSHVPCHNGDATCGEVSKALEMRRRNIGGWCGTPNVAAQSMLLGLGRDAVPYLATVFDDPDDEIAQLALDVTVEVGCPQVVVAWCEGIRDRWRLQMCRHALAHDTRAPPGASCSI
jgi:hypothetical protein